MAYKDPEKQKAAQRKSYEKNRATNIARSQQYKKRNRQFVWDFKEANPCTDCGKYYPHYQMQFDHIKEKVHKVSSLIAMRGLDVIKKEMAKCELVCANCHCARTWSRNQSGHAVI